MTIAQPGGTPLAQRMVGVSLTLQNASLTRLATGLRINAGRDDPAGLISSQRLRATLAALDAESRALQRADHVAGVADAALGDISDLLADAQALAVANAGTGAMSPAERRANQAQLDSIVQSIDRIASTTTFNGQPLLDGTATIRAGSESLSLDNVSPREIGIVDAAGATHDLADVSSGAPLNIADGDAGAALEAIRTAASQIASMRAELGAFSKRLIGPALASNAVAIENTAAAETFVRDTDYASETSSLIRAQVLTRTSIFALTRSVARGESVLLLIG